MKQQLFIIALLFIFISIFRCDHAGAIEFDYLGYMPSAPLILLGVEPDQELASLISEVENSEEYITLMPSLPDSAGGSVDAALLSLFMQIARQPSVDRHSITAVCALIRPTESFSMVPTFALLLKSDSTKTLPLEILRPYLNGINLYQPDGELLAPADNGMQLSIYSAYVGPYLVLSGEQNLLKTFLNAPIDRTQSEKFMPIISAMEKSPGRLWGYCNGSVFSLISLYTSYYISEDWTDELDEFRALSFGISPRRNISPKDEIPNIFTLHLQKTPEAQGALNLLQRFKLNGRADIIEPDAIAVTHEPAINLNFEMQTDWESTYPAFLNWLKWHWSQDTKDIMQDYDDLAQMTGIHIPRDFINHLTGKIRVSSTTNLKGKQTWLNLELNDPEAMKSALDRAAIWSSDFASRGVAQQFFQKAGENHWLLKSTHGVEPKLFLIRNNPALSPRDSFFKDELIIILNGDSPTPSITPGMLVNNDINANKIDGMINFKMENTDSGIILQCDWKELEHLKIIMPDLESCTESIGSLLGFQENPPAVIAGKALVKPKKNPEISPIPDLH